MIISRWHSKCTKNLIILLLLLVLQRRCEWVNEYLTVWFDVMWCYDATTNQWKPSPCNLFHQKYICNLLLLDKHKQKIEWSWTQSPEAASIDFALLGYYVSIDFVSTKKDAWRRRAIVTSLEKVMQVLRENSYGVSSRFAVIPIFSANTRTQHHDSCWEHGFGFSREGWKRQGLFDYQGRNVYDLYVIVLGIAMSSSL